MALPNTHYGAEKIGALLSGRPRLFFDGIGGISMNALAHISHLQGFDVSGYDRTPSPITEKLEKMGIPVYYTASESHLYDRDALIYTVAMAEDNPEYHYAVTHGIPVISRADFLGYLMHGFTNRIGVSGTHGKSTTTGMLSQILTTAMVDPTVIGGAEMKQSNSVDIIGAREYFVFEACEYMDSFLDFYPTVAVVLNIELDHVDYFPSLDAIRTSFTAFMNKTGETGYAVVNADDTDCIRALDGYIGHAVTFGRENPLCDYRAELISSDHGRYAFRVHHHGKTTDVIRLQVPGVHCVLDGTAAFAAASVCGISDDAIVRGLSAYRGIVRRMDEMGRSPSGAAVFADYAHHPTEIAATLAGCAKMGYRKTVVVFQSHTYSRTSELFGDFRTALAESAADEIVLCPIYAARETNIYGVSAEGLGTAIRESGKSCTVCDSLQDAARIANAHTGEDDMILVMGAGDVIQVAEELVGAQH